MNILEIRKMILGIPKTPPSSFNPNICYKCDTLFQIDENELQVCPKCGLMEQTFVDQNDTYEHTVVSYKKYLRITYFKELINRFQGKIKPISYGNIHLIHYLIGENEINPQTIRSALKELRLAKYYPDFNHIIFRLNGTLPPDLSLIENQIYYSFHRINEEYFKLGKTLNYPFVLNKMLMEYGYSYPLFISANSMKKYENIWKEICDKLK